MEFDVAATSFLEYLSALVDTLSDFLLLVFRQLNDLSAFVGAASVVFLLTRIALNKEQMATIVLTVRVIIARIATLMTYRNDIFCYPFAKALIKHKILTDESIFQSVFFDLL